MLERENDGFFDFPDFNAPLLLYELTILNISCVIGLSCSGCAAAPCGAARATSDHLLTWCFGWILSGRKLEICKRYQFLTNTNYIHKHIFPEHMDSQIWDWTEILIWENHFFSMLMTKFLENFDFFHEYYSASAFIKISIVAMTVI